ncbi:acyl-CoA thioesterase I [Reinekea blandensis MED297]|uniref:Acyl-CoA thioesterase I n=2 Tax=Reinekea TaxID=230494 RepID=A4BE42_9GAMM|nr:acyl-CoA thioesterase I [Reinekea blandensis MED297]
MWFKRRLAHHLGTLIVVTVLSVSFTSAETILVHGDSLSAGYGIEVSDGWVALMDDALGTQTQVVNSSISGETSRGGLDRLPGLLEAHQPDILILELGANDGLRGYPLTQLRDNLEQMIQMAQNQGARVVLLGMRLPPNLGRRYIEPFMNIYSDLASTYNLPFLPFMLEGVAENRELMQADGLHPTAAAQPILLDNILSLVEEAR